MRDANIISKPDVKNNAEYWIETRWQLMRLRVSAVTGVNDEESQVSCLLMFLFLNPQLTDSIRGMSSVLFEVGARGGVLILCIWMFALQRKSHWRGF